MRKVLAILILCFAASFFAEAKIWRVNNNPGASANFTTAQAAHDGASNGDTLIIEPSLSSYGNLALTKRLVVLGSGYFLNEYPTKQLKGESSLLSGVTFDDAYNTNNTLKSTSAGSVLSGLEIQAGITITVSNVNINRCYSGGQCAGIYITNGAGNTGAYSTSNISITQNFLACGRITILANGSTTVSNVLIRNNIIRGDVYAYLNTNCIIQNNTFTYTQDFYLHDATFQDNIIYTHPQISSTKFTGRNTSILNNVFSANYGTGSGTNPGMVYANNLANVNILSVFVADPVPSNPPAGYTSDNRFMVKAGSPSIGAGNNGADTGAFAGGTPYILAGIPAIPSIYEYIVPASGQNSLNVKMSVRSNP